jgi:hypothetical protein
VNAQRPPADASTAFTRTDKLLRFLVRLTGLGFGVLAAFEVRVFSLNRLTGTAVIAVFLALLAIGLLRLHRFAVRAAEALLALAAIGVPAAFVNPFFASDMIFAGEVDEDFAWQTIRLAYGLSAVCLGWAFLIGRARLRP